MSFTPVLRSPYGSWSRAFLLSPEQRSSGQSGLNPEQIWLAQASRTRPADLRQSARRFMLVELRHALGRTVADSSTPMPQPAPRVTIVMTTRERYGLSLTTLDS